MNVLCERCQTEYEFDDALVSERGTTVKCTSCGHQFRIFRPKTSSSSPERWEVFTSDGRELVFTSMRDLQRGIARGQVGRSDTLKRGTLPARPVAEIAELEMFFPQGRTNPPPAMKRHEPSQRDSLGPELAPPRVPRDMRDIEYEEKTVPVISVGTDHTIGTSATITDDLLHRPPGLDEALSQTVAQADAEAPTVLPDKQDGPAKSEDPEIDAGEESAADAASEAAANAASDAQVRLAAPPPKPVATSKRTPSVRVTPAPVSDSAVEEIVAPSRRSDAIRLVVAVVLIGGLVLIGVTIGKKYLDSAATRASLATGGKDSQVTGLLREGHKLLREGDLEGAKASFDKASVLAESDAQVQLALAELENVRSDLVWLKLRLLNPQNTEEINRAKRELDMRSKRGLAAAERAWALNKGGGPAARVRVDSWRLAGDLEQARSLVTKLEHRHMDPQDAYVLAALEMSEAAPNWATVISRLKLAESDEQGFGRVRGVLAYALVRLGDLDGARSQMQRLRQQSSRYPLLPELSAFLDRATLTEPVTAHSDAGADVETAAMSVNALTPLRQGGGFANDDEAAGEQVPAGSYQDSLRRAHAARKQGDLNTAEQLYRTVLAQHPGDTEALAGLGDIAKSRGDKSGSVGYYEQVSKQNPSYLPAQMGLADAKWEAGDRAGAIVIYKHIVATTGGQGSYAQRARQRIAQGAGTETHGTSHESATQPTTAPTTPSPPSTTYIDTTDLP